MGRPVHLEIRVRRQPGQRLPYRGWALLGIVVVGALLSTGMVARLARAWSSEFKLTVLAASCIALSLVIFFLLTYPANQQTQNWTMLPEN